MSEAVVDIWHRQHWPLPSAVRHIVFYSRDSKACCSRCTKYGPAYYCSTDYFKEHVPIQTVQILDTTGK